MQLRTERLLRLLLGGLTLALVVWGTWTLVALLSRGPGADRFQTYVLFKDVGGLQIGSRVVHRGMSIGEVAALELDASAGRVRALLALDPEARSAITTTSQFWVVRPRFSGIGQGLSGLDTLIKESYVTLRARSGGQPLEAGEELLGLEHPPEDLAEDDLDEAMIGDLIATVVLPDSHGLKSGSPVFFRGMQCGDVRRVRLSKNGDGVLIRYRVLRAQRTLVREDSRFWVSRPVLQGGLLTGIQISSLGSLFTTGLSFDTERDSKAEPLADFAVTIGLAAPPIDVETWDGQKVDTGESTSTPGERDARERLLQPWVQVRYRAVERDTLSADDDVQAHGEGVLFFSPKGELCVLTTRSASDGTYLVEGNWLDSVRIDKERIRVVLGDGRVWPARRIWTADDLDLAVLRVQAPVNAPPAPLPPAEDYLDFGRETGLPEPAADRNAPYVLRDGGRAFGFVGHAKADPGTRVTVSAASLPVELRPDRK